MPTRDEYPTWDVDPEFPKDVFTFVRVHYDASGPFGWWDRWDNDFPDSEMNFSYRLQELTSFKVSQDWKVLRLTDEELFDYPFIYMAGVQTIELVPREAASLRKYLLNGGFLMMDDFWSPSGWRHVSNEMQQVFPDRQPRELTLDHPIFHIVYDLKALPQVVDIQTWSEGYNFEYRHNHSGNDESPHFWAYFDDNGRIMCLMCHNNDVGDGWEREGEQNDYFRDFSEKQSYPMGINIVTYAMTH
jgi:hypothetical protein